jgi:hypothetical protein
MINSDRQQPSALICPTQRVIAIVSLCMALGCAGSQQRDSYEIAGPVSAMRDDAATGRIATCATTYASYQFDLDITVIAVTTGGVEGYYSRICELAQDATATIQSSHTQQLVAGAKVRLCEPCHILKEIEDVVADAAIKNLAVVCGPEHASTLSVELPEKLGYKPQQVQWLTAKNR